MQVRDSQDRRDVVFEDEEDAERKPMQNRSAEFTKDPWKLQGPLFHTCEGRAKFTEEFKPKAGLFAFIPRAGLEHVEFCLSPNVEPGHLLASSKTMLNSVDDVPPGADFAWRPAMRSQPFL